MTYNIKDFEFIHFESIDSTNNYAKTLCKSGVKNKVIIADTQTNGRTTKKQGWISPKGNLYFSILLPLDDEKILPEYSFISALAIVESINELNSISENVVKIKWPNDVLLNKQKLCGILIEKEDDCVIIGIGVNIIYSPAPELTRYPTTNLLKNGINVDVKTLAELILKNLVSNINIRLEKGFDEIISKIVPYMYKFNDTIYISVNNQTLVGKFYGIDKSGALLL
ncbi:MAG: biotin--[Alphaproteobacteria bacterium]|nr:biotin--[acetyl-CoA-carboxylase] ligase [Alphaproteobacteria bacterium]